MIKLVAAATFLSFPAKSPVVGELYRAPDGNYVGRMMFEDGALLTLLDGFSGSGAWCADVARLRDSVFVEETVCGMGLVTEEITGKRLQLYGPGVAVNELMLWSEP